MGVIKRLFKKDVREYKVRRTGIIIYTNLLYYKKIKRKVRYKRGSDRKKDRKQEKKKRRKQNKDRR